MALSGALQEGLMVTVVGLIIVFAVLIILMITMMIMKKVFYKDSAEKGKTEEIKNANASASATTPVSMQNRQFAKEVKDENTLIAIFASAIAASLDTQVGSIKVHSYKCISDNTSKEK